MMKISVISLFPEMFNVLDYGILGRAIRQGLVSLDYLNPRDFTQDVHRTVDDRPYGGGPGMVMLFEPLHRAIYAAKQNSDAKVIHLSPQGRPLSQPIVEDLAREPHLVLVCSRYEGVDERVIESDIDEELSLGDYVVSGGELPSMILMDAITRLLPGALGNALSSEEDSFSNGLFDCPHYTRPKSIEGRKVPKVLLNGNHEAINRWRLKQKLGRTWQKRPDLIKRRILSSKEQRLLDEYCRELAEGKTHE